MPRTKATRSQKARKRKKKHEPKSIFGYGADGFIELGKLSGRGFKRLRRELSKRKEQRSR